MRIPMKMIQVPKLYQYIYVYILIHIYTHMTIDAQLQLYFATQSLYFM